MPDDRSIKSDLIKARELIDQATVILTKSVAGRVAGVIAPEKPAGSHILHPLANHVMTAGAASLMQLSHDLEPLTNPHSGY